MNIHPDLIPANLRRWLYLAGIFLVAIAPVLHAVGYPEIAKILAAVGGMGNVLAIAHVNDINVDINKVGGDGVA